MNRRKLQVPAPASGSTVPSRLIKLLEKEADRPLIALVAPIGYGKTLLLSERAAALAAANNSVCWLTLDDADNEPQRLLAHVAEALSSARERSGAKPEPPENVQPSPGTTMERIAQALSGSQTETLHLFFDRCEAIQSEQSQRLFEHWLAHSGPHIRFYFASREALPFVPSLLGLSPGPLTLTREHLKLNDSEMLAFIKRKTGRSLPFDALARLEQATEGWPLALDIFASQLEEGRARPRTVDEAIDSMSSELESVFRDAILNRQPERLRRFLLTLSSSASFDTELCRRLTLDEAAADLLEQAMQQNLLLFRGTDGRYRFHPLFARFLHDRFKTSDKNGFLAVQARAVAWLETTGQTVEAARQALEMPDYDRAASLLLADIGATFSYPRQRMIRLLERFPSPELARRPAIALICAWYLTAEHRISAAEAVLDEAEALMTEPLYLLEPTGEDLRGYFASVRSRIYFIRRDTAKGMAYMQRCAELLNGPGRLYSRFNTIDPHGSSLLKSDAGHGGAIDQTVEMCEMAEPAWNGINQGFGIIHILLGECHYERNRPELAEKLLQSGRKIGLDLMDSGLILPATLALVQLKRTQGERQAAYVLLQETTALLFDRLGDEGRAVLSACRARLDMKENRHDSVNGWLRRRPDIERAALGMNNIYEQLTLLRALLFVRHDRQALKLGEKLLHYCESWNISYYAAEVSFLLAVIYDRADDRATSFRRLELALELGLKEGYLQLFLSEWDIAEPLLQKYGRLRRPQSGSASQRLAAFCAQLSQMAGEKALETDRLHYARQRLTQQEYKILQCLIAGKSNAAIAAELGIRIETAKTHCRNIYRKLRLNSRKEVAARFSI